MTHHPLIHINHGRPCDIVRVKVDNDKTGIGVDACAIIHTKDDIGECCGCRIVRNFFSLKVLLRYLQCTYGCITCKSFKRQRFIQVEGGPLIVCYRGLISHRRLYRRLKTDTCHVVVRCTRFNHIHIPIDHGVPSGKNRTTILYKFSIPKKLQHTRCKCESFVFSPICA